MDKYLTDAYSVLQNYEKLKKDFEEHKSIINKLKLEKTNTKMPLLFGKNKYRQKISALDNQIKSEEIKLQKLDQQISAKEAEYNKAYSEIKKHEAPKRRMEILARELAKFGGIKDKLIEECLTFGVEAVPHLLAVLESSEGGDVCEALGRIGDDRAVDALIRVFERDKQWMGKSNSALAESAAIALGRIGDARAIAPLLTAYQFNSGGKAEVAYALGKLGVSKVEEDIKEMIAHAETSWDGPYITRAKKQMLIDVLQELRSKTLSPDQALSMRRQDILKALSSKEVALRKAACYESAAIGGPEIVAALIMTLQNYPQIQYNEASDVYQCSRKGAAYALGKLADPSSIAALHKALNEPEPSLPAGAPFAFGTNVRKGLEEAATEFSRSVLLEHQNLVTTTKAENDDTLIIKGFMWQLRCDGIERTQADAFAYCKSLELSGYHDWRLPSLNDFMSLGKNLEEAFHDYWTSTPEPRLSPDIAYISDGTTMFKTNKYYVRAVRDL